MGILYFILVIIILIIFLIIVIPLKIKVNLNIKTNNENSEEKLKMENKIEIYILRIVKIKTIDLRQKDKVDLGNKESTKVVDDISKLTENIITFEKRNSIILNKKDLKKLIKNISFDKFYLILGFNFKDPIINAYVIAVLNSLINIYIAKNVNNFNLENTAYKTYISNKIIDFNFFSIINFKLVNNIIIIFKIIKKIRKVVNKNG